MDLSTPSDRIKNSPVQTDPSFEKVESLYDQNRFIDAYRKCTPYFEDLSNVRKLPIRSIILLGRLARRLGGFELHNRIFDIARDRSPNDPLVRHFAGRTADSHNHLISHLQEIEKTSADAFENDADKASWLGSTACVYASIRDFETAHRHLDEAFTLSTERAWIHCCQAEVLCMEDRWQHALGAAEKAWAMSPGMPQGTITLGRILAKKEGVGAAAERLLNISHHTQSNESLLTILWYLCANAERQSEPKTRELAEQAQTLSKRLDALAPLKDDHFASTHAIIQTEIAWLLRDFDSMRSQASVVEHPFYASVLKNIESAKTSDVIITRHAPVFQKHNTCLPASVASVLSSFDRYIDVDALSEELTFRGTALWRVMDWLEQRDYKAVPFIADAQIAVRLLENGLPFVICVKTVSQYHAMAAIGVDTAAGVLLVHDPGQARMEKYLLSELGKFEIPFGLEALAIVPKSQAKRLSLIPTTASAPYAAYLDYLKTVETKGNTAGLSIIQKLGVIHPGHPFLTRLEAIHASRMGMSASALKRQLKLLKMFPDCEHVRQELLNSLYHTENTHLIRKVLAQLVLKKRIPGFSAAQKWQYVPAEYVAQFATYGAMMDLGDTTVEKLLWEAIEREPVHAGCHHALGDYHSMKEDTPRSILPYRCSAMLDLENHHYARAYLNALAKVRQLDDGLAFLERRTQKLGDSLGGGEVWISMIEAYEDYGLPDNATAAMKKATAERPDDPYLLHWAVKFWSRMGAGQKAFDCLGALKQSGNNLLYHSASTAFYKMRGQWRRALRHCKKWKSEEPKNPVVLREYLAFFAMAEGKNAALDLSEKWWSRNKGNDEIELIFLDQLKELHKYDRQLEVLRARIRRNPFDVWAYRELGFLLIQVIDIGEHRDMTAIGKELEETITKCKRLAPDNAVITALEADWASYQGERGKAISLYKKAIKQDPAYGYAYQSMWSLTGHLPEDERRSLFRLFEKNMFLTPDFLYLSETLSKMAAECFGSAAAHQIVDRWLERYPKDPEVSKAKIALLLDYGQGRTDAQAAVGLLNDFIERFPYEPALRYMLSRAYRVLNDDTNWVKTSHAIVKQFPLSSIQRRQLAEYFQRKGEISKAKTILQDGIHVRPLDTWLRNDLIRLLFESKQIEEAKALMDESLLKIPEDITFRIRMVDLLFEYGEDALAVEVARLGTEVYPEGAALWKHYGDALWRSILNSDMNTVEEIYLKSLAFNPRYENAADRLSQLYANQNRYDDARSIIKAQLPHHVDKGALLTRLAWIERQAGDKMAALKQLVKVVEEWPRERWAWLLLIEWIEADENWFLAKSTLKNVHPVMNEDPSFMSDKLYLLHKAGEVDPQAEWETLLHNFPENEKAHCLRFDILLDAGDLDAAEKVLDAIESRRPTSPYLLARRVALKVDQKDFDQAVQVAMKMFQLPYDVGQWCRGTVLQSFKNYNELPILVSTAVDAWENGTYIESNCFLQILGFVGSIWKTETWFPKLCRFLGIYPEAVKRLHRMLDLAVQRDDERGNITAAILSRLDDFNQRRFLIDFSKRHRELSQSKTGIWQIVGFAYVTGSQKEAEMARQWLSSWRNHDSCELWIVSNLIIAIERSRKLKLKQKLDQILTEAGDGLRTLPPDNLTQFVVSKYCEAALRLGQKEAFLAMARQYENVLRDAESGYWGKKEEVHLPWAILRFLGLLSSDGGNVKSMTKQFKSAAGNHILKSWVLPEWKRWVKRIVSA
ncbi:MAG: hypothetical protein P8X96_14850 [Desulfobacteraceae bacterium]